MQSIYKIKRLFSQTSKCKLQKTVILTLLSGFIRRQVLLNDSPAYNRKCWRRTLWMQVYEYRFVNPAIWMQAILNKFLAHHNKL